MLKRPECLYLMSSAPWCMNRSGRGFMGHPTAYGIKYDDETKRYVRKGNSNRVTP